MKKMLVLTFMTAVFFLMSPALSQAASDFGSVQAKVSEKCNYDPKTQEGKFIPYQTGNCLLSNVALELEVPAEIVKAVATKESVDWQQFDANGDPIISGDGGIGIMQITVYPAGDKELLERNAVFNIYSGVKRLKDYMIVPIGTGKPAPVVQGDDPAAYLERWYFSALRYNGIKPKNSPLLICGGDGSRNSGAYQEELYSLLQSDSGKGIQDITTRISHIDMAPSDFSYTCGSADNIIFNKTSFTLNGPMTETKHLFNKNDTLITYNDDTADPKIRSGATGSAPLVKAGKGIAVKTAGEFVYDTASGSTNQFVWYPVQLKDSQTKGYIASSYLKRVTTRLAGDNRYNTAIEISKEGWKQSGTVVIATGQNFADALSGTPLAAKYNAPLLLVNSNPNAANTAVFNEIKRLKATKAILLGGSNVVSSTTENTLKELGLSVSRIAGSDRYVTSAKIAEQLSSATAVLAIGDNFADAVSIAPFAAKNGHPILLTRKSSIPTAVKPALAAANKAYVIGGESVISKEVFDSLAGKNPVRLSGKDRYATSKVIAQELPLGNNEIFAATGENFPDALSGAVLASKNNSSILLVKPTKPGLDVIDIYQSVTILGGPTLITPKMESDMINLLK
ncbi:cell wall-binding repeat-containing protein [Bacillus sp. FSL H8-0547]